MKTMTTEPHDSIPFPASTKPHTEPTSTTARADHRSADHRHRSRTEHASTDCTTPANLFEALHALPHRGRRVVRVNERCVTATLGWNRDTVERGLDDLEAAGSSTGAEP